MTLFAILILCNFVWRNAASADEDKSKNAWSTLFCCQLFVFIVDEIVVCIQPFVTFVQFPDDFNEVKGEESGRAGGGGDGRRVGDNHNLNVFLNLIYLRYFLVTYRLFMCL